MRWLLAACFFLGFLLGSCGGDDWVKVADCATGPAWHIDDELVCDDHAQTAFAFREWRAGETPASACEFCESRGANR